MNIEVGRKLLDELCGALESEEERPATPLARKALRLAGLLDMRRYELLFKIHLEGIQSKAPSPETDATNFDEEAFARKAFTRDRMMANGLVQNHQLHIIEELHARMLQARNEQGTNTEQEFELRQMLQRIRSRIGEFTLEAERALAAEKPTVVSERPLPENLMSLIADASLVLRSVAEFEDRPGDERRGYHNLNQHGVVATLNERWNIVMSPERINEAVDILENNGYIKVRRGPGTTPYKFSGVELTAGGRLQHEKQIERMKAEAEKPPAKGTKIFFGHGGSTVWKEFRDYVVHRLELDWDEFGREATAGYTTKERLEQMLDDAAFAFLVMTAEDERADGTKIARSNVLHEIGLFQGRLGFRRAIVLLENGCEEFSNIHGVTQIRFDRANVAAKFDEIRHTLEREGLVKKS